MLKRALPETGWPADALYEAARFLGIDAVRAEILRIGHCAVVSLPASGLVVRVARPGSSLERVRAELAFARHIAAAGIPAVQPAVEVASEPVVTTAGPVTFWPLLRPGAAAMDCGWLGRTLRRLHSLPLPADLVSLWDPIGVVERRVDAYAVSRDARADFVSLFRKAAANAREVLDELALSHRAALIHGDPANVFTTDEGPMLIDFDLSGIGPPTWDLASIAIRQRRFALADGELGKFIDAYGSELFYGKAFERLLRVRELLDCSFVLSVSGEDTRAQEELAVRLRALRGDSDRSTWTSLE